MSSIGDKLVQYCDAYYPIVYIDTYEDAKTDSIISEAFKRGYNVEEWNGATGHCDFKNKNSFYSQKPLLLKQLFFFHFFDSLSAPPDFFFFYFIIIQTFLLPVFHLTLRFFLLQFCVKN